MLGHTHAVSGMAAGAALLPLVPLPNAAAQLAWVACCGGMALLPDLDHEDSTATRMWGPLSAAIAWVVTFLSRGHRGGTHDFIVAPVAFGAAAYAASFNRWTSMFVIALAIGLALRACHFVIPGQAEKSWPINLLASAAAAWWLVSNGAAAGATWLPFAVGVGVLVHIVGDALTEGGVPRPFSWFDGKPNRMRGGPLTTGRWYEHVLAAGFVAVAAWLLYANVPLLTQLVDQAAAPFITVQAGV